MKPELTPWDLFVLRHTSPGNLIVHFVSCSMFFGAPLVALATWNPWWLAPFFASGLVGAAGHWLFRDSGVSVKEAAASPEVPMYVLRMFYELARGTYWPHVASARERAARRV